MSEATNKQATEFQVPQGPHYEFPVDQTGQERTEIVSVTPMDLLQIAMNQNADLDRLEKLMELQMRWEQNVAKKEFAAAKAAFMAEAPAILKNKSVDYTTKAGNHVKYDHATLDQVVSAVIGGLSKHGVTHRWTVAQSEGQIRVTCILTRGAYSEETTMQSGPDDSGGKNAIQAIASAMKYLQRYTLLAATGLEAGNGDNDGQGAPMQELQMHLDRIKGAVDAGALERAYKDAVKAALETKNTAAVNSIVKAKDERKKVLLNETAA